jgi:plastocyanin
MRKLLLVILALVLLAACRSPQPTPENTTENQTFLNPGYHEVVMDNFIYNPKSLTVYQGDRVKWINNMPFVKSVWIWGQDPSPIIKTGKSWSYIFTEPGFYKIRDQFAQDMEGNITVLPYDERPDVQASTPQVGP